MSDLDNDILEAVKHLPNVTRAELVDLLSPTHKKMAVGMGITKLVRRRKLATGEKPNPKRRGRRTIQTFVIPQHDKIPEKKATVPEFQRMKREVEELRAWKEEAIRRFPDLAVPAIVIEARALVATELDNGHKAEVLAGKKDDSPIMRAVLAALKRD